MFYSIEWSSFGEPVYSLGPLSVTVNQISIISFWIIPGLPLTLDKLNNYNMLHLWYIEVQTPTPCIVCPQDYHIFSILPLNQWGSNQKQFASVELMSVTSWSLRENINNLETRVMTLRSKALQIEWQSTLICFKLHEILYWLLNSTDIIHMKWENSSLERSPLSQTIL